MFSLTAFRASTMLFYPEDISTSATACCKLIESSTSPHLIILPEEIIVKIFEWCDFKEVLACRLTCRALKQVISGSITLRYKLALSENGMCDVTSRVLSTAEKLEMLTAHVAAWQNLHSSQPEKVGLLVGWSAPRAVSGSILVFSKDVHATSDGHIRSRHGEHRLEVRPKPRLDLLVFRVPSALRRVEAAHWVLDLPADAGGVCIDASQDLLIYVLDSKFYACTLSTGTVHPLAEHDGFFNMWHGTRRFDVFNLRVWGDYVAAGTRVYFISVWNWKKGYIVSDQISEVNFSSFDFLDEHHILYSVSKEDSIYVCDLRSCAEHQQQQSQMERGTEKEAEPLRFQLALPPINRATTSRYIQLRRNALPAVREHPSVVEGNSPPFHADPRERLIVLRVVTSPVEHGEEQFELHVPARILLEHFTAAQQAGNKDMVLPWSAWHDAVRATPPRKVPYAVQAQMVAYGMRAVSHPPNWDEGTLYVDSYFPQKRREAGTGGGETRQAVRLPNELPGKADFLSVLCEDALLCYKLDSSMSKIAHAYWYLF
ncbi:hypothetical protein BJV78DRAFT_1280787 [Lactifluus subvellereus]|nr:hypothetical protein BJV78DRAFT_1280787 [Lactifluus subvellereus]